jgi:hypothetical protein
MLDKHGAERLANQVMAGCGWEDLPSRLVLAGYELAKADDVAIIQERDQAIVRVCELTDEVALLRARVDRMLGMMAAFIWEDEG